MGGFSDIASRLRAISAQWRENISAVAGEWKLFVERPADARSGVGILAQIKPERFSAVGLALVINILAIWILAENMQVTQLAPPPNLYAKIFPAQLQAQPPPEPHLVSPNIALVPEPMIVIEPDTPKTTTITAMSMAQMLAPRPDTNHINVPPQLPAVFRTLGNGISMVLKIFVQPDGSISDAHVMRTSGDAKLDEIAVEYVKANWRYIPASISGSPVEDWTTVLVPFKA
jgi:TonB family protein